MITNEDFTDKDKEPSICFTSYDKYHIQQSKLFSPKTDIESFIAKTRAFIMTLDDPNITQISISTLYLKAELVEHIIDMSILNKSKHNVIISNNLHYQRYIILLV